MYIFKAAVVGAGTMGSGIALAALYAGLEVGLQDVSPEVLEWVTRKTIGQQEPAAVAATAETAAVPVEAAAPGEELRLVCDPGTRRVDEIEHRQPLVVRRFE